jgi:hypothetical protein
MERNKFLRIVYLWMFVIAAIPVSYFAYKFIKFDIEQKEPIRTIFLSKSTDIKPTMRKVLQMENIRVYQYSDSLGTTTIFASEFDFLSNTQSQGK